MAVIEIRDVSFSYPRKQVFEIKELNFEIGKSYALMGESGSGKSTLLKLISGIEKAQKGAIIVNGDAKQKGASFIKDNICFILQKYNLVNHLTVYQNLCLMTSVRNGEKSLEKAYALSLLKRVGLESEILNKSVKTISEGQKQRVAIIQILLSNVPIILADEPTANLDTDNENSIVGLLNQIAHDENRCVLVATHSRYVASQMDACIINKNMKVEYHARENQSVLL